MNNKSANKKNKNEKVNPVLSEKPVGESPMPRGEQIYLNLKKLLIWGCFFGVIYLMKDLFSVVFFTFILGFIIYRVNEFIVSKINISRKLNLIILYLILISIVAGIGYFLGPKFFDEGKEFARKIPDIETKARQKLEELKQSNPAVNQMLKSFTTKEQIEEYIFEAAQKIIKSLPEVLLGILKMSTAVLLAIIFSFLILMDLAEVVQELKKFESARISALYNELAQPIVRFAHIVGLAFEAQTIIALANTILTGIGLFFLGIKEVAFLSIIVFICSFIPVLGVFISSVPIVLIAFNTGGPGLAMFAILMVIIVHAVEAYILNPRIYAAHMKINPVFVLIVLFIGHHAFGIWGMLLSVPVTFYFMRYIAGLKTMIQAEKKKTPGADFDDTEEEEEI